MILLFNQTSQRLCKSQISFGFYRYELQGGRGRRQKKKYKFYFYLAEDMCDHFRVCSNDIPSKIWEGGQWEEIDTGYKYFEK